jgi:hypothetical protein
MNGEVIPGLYCGGGFNQHGLARAACQGHIAGGAAATPLLEQGIVNTPISRSLSSGAGRVSAVR